LSIATLFLALFSVGYAWFRNNREAVISSSDSIQIKGNGVMVTAYSTDASGAEISASAATYQSELPMNLNGKYMDVSGDGLSVYTAMLDSDGQPKANEWSVAEADTAVGTNDSGKYVVADIYFKSDSPMDIYLMQDAEVSPATDDGGNDWVNKGSYSGYTQFNEFSGGLPSLNINQSAFGLFSRNLIAGATRVSFSEYSYESSGWVAPSYANLVWVPNSTYQLTAQANANLLANMTLNGTKEQSYQYYNGSATNYVITRVNSQLTGKLSIRKTSSSAWEDVPVRMISNGILIPAKNVNATNPIPQIWANGNYYDAAYNENLKCFVQAVYADNYNINDYAYVSSLSGVEYVKKVVDGYVKCAKVSGTWVEVTPQVKYTDSSSITAADIEESF